MPGHFQSEFQIATQTLSRGRSQKMGRLRNMLPRALGCFTLFQLVGFAKASSDSSAAQWSDFTDKFATDLAPLITLFGEQVTKQFLSESTSFLDSIIFGMAPLGIITAVVSVIRVRGTSALKSIIGRAQEPHGQAEMELCSSTSHDVCELWSNGGICRVFGQPKILELFFLPGRKELYPTYSGEEPEVDLSNSRCKIIPSNLKWRQTAGERFHDGFAPYPNLTLNLGFRLPRRWEQLFVTVLAVTIQAGFFVFASWVTFAQPDLYEGDDPPPTWGFHLAVIGTVMVSVGMISCARVIDEQSEELWFEQSTKGPGSETSNETYALWLQPGGQRVGDQQFSAFFCQKKITRYVRSWKRRETRPAGVHQTLLLGAVLASTLAGFVLQFVGLRSMHGSVALYQIAAALFMSIVRAMMRLRTTKPQDNEFDNLRVEGRELSQLAMRL
ncbi:hypothetical protein B0T21DRAFT_313512, partial [Apiosordaria backusii]